MLWIPQKHVLWHIRDRWNRKVLSLRKRHQREPTLSDLSYFIEEESALVNDPFFSNSAVDECLEKPLKPARRSFEDDSDRSKGR